MLSHDLGGEVTLYDETGAGTAARPRAARSRVRRLADALLVAWGVVAGAAVENAAQRRAANRRTCSPADRISRRVQALVARSADLGRPVSADGLGVAAIASQSGMPGSVVVRVAGRPTDTALSVLDAGAMNIGALLLSRERLLAAESREMGDTLRGLLDVSADDLGTLSAHVARYGLRLDRQQTAVAVIDVAGLAPGKTVERTRQALGSDPALFGFHDGRLVVLLAGAAGSAQVVERLRQVLSRDGSTPATVCLDKGPFAGGELPRAVSRAQQCLLLALALARRGCTNLAPELAPYTVAFRSLSTTELDLYIASVIGPVLDHDAARGTQLTETLSVFLSAGAACAPRRRRCTSTPTPCVSASARSPG